jgi:hypothetical protein
MMLVVVVSGYVGRYLLVQVGRAIQGRRSDLAALTAAFERVSADLARDAPTGPMLASPFARLARRWFLPANAHAGAERPSAGRLAVRLADAMVDVDYAVRAEEVVRDLFGKWLKLHILIAMILYTLLALHVWSGLYYGLRWLP